MPFLINIISALWIVIKITYNRSNIKIDQTFQQHRHILIAPYVLILLTLPRLIITFISGCMRSARKPWLHLLCYFISFIPSMLTFIVFVLPSTNYKNEFDRVVQKTIKIFCSQ
ncbi:hypothetical protein I4U23_007748 [Adineta vaga]|nr:hypothetical protein I4U23_007748 [Adineta vaga]